jgi:DnaA family protein
MIPRQLAFDLANPPQPTLDNFVIGANAELVQHLRGLTMSREQERSLYIWGDHGSGRTHLLQAATAALAGCGFRVSYTARGATPPDGSQAIDGAAVDDVDLLTPEGESALFRLYNVLKERGGILLAAGNAPPAELRLRADVVTRLAWGLVYEVHALSDAEKARMLTEHAASRGFDLAPELANYLLARVPRDMRTLVAMVHTLDRYSIETKRPVTLSLVREMLKDQS